MLSTQRFTEQLEGVIRTPAALGATVYAPTG